MLAALRSLWEPSSPVAVEFHGTPRKRPFRRKTQRPAYGSWMLTISSGGNIDEEEFLIISSEEFD